ncbi:MAG TPA: hypothetical protein VNZ52_15060, partial [Candidatus Thermoplasmatota archaeon]|nr:hypothetical protein [Candidatus Thermoplasmatota archaeon]
MARRTLAFALLTATLLVGTALAGCLGGQEAPVDPQTVNTTKEEEPTFVNPEGRGVSAAANETNKTVVGKGGIEHLHDYWEGQTEKVIFDGPVKLRDPVFCDNKDTNKMGCFILQLPVSDPAVLVYEGAARVTVTATNFQPWLTGLEVRYKNGANTEWSSAAPLAPDAAFDIPVSAIETDMPHASASQWAWKFIGNKNLGPSTSFLSFFDTQAKYGPVESLPDDFNVKITVHKGDKIVDWPGHPDFYADKPYRVVMDKRGATHNTGIQDQWLYGDEANVIRPDLLISSGTGNLTFYLNVTSSKLNGAEMAPDTFYIDYTNATGRWDGAYTEWNAFVNRLTGNKTDSGAYHFDMPVDYGGWDSPYAPVSGWQFLVRSSYSQDTPARSFGFCPGCFPYEVDFQMTVIAYP